MLEALRVFIAGRANLICVNTPNSNILQSWKAIDTSSLSRPKPDTRICDNDQHANIKFKSNINKNQLNYYKTFTKASLFLFILDSLLKWNNFSFDIQSIYTVLKE